jgi:hypothetical protein
MFNDYYIFNKEIGEKLKELGFELDKDTLTYKKICYDLDMIVSYEITDDMVLARRLNYPLGCKSMAYITKITDKTFDSIIDALKSSLNDLHESYGFVVKYSDIKPSKYKTEIRRLETGRFDLSKVVKELESKNYYVKRAIAVSNYDLDGIKIYY